MLAAILQHAQRCYTLTCMHRMPCCNYTDETTLTTPLPTPLPYLSPRPEWLMCVGEGGFPLPQADVRGGRGFPSPPAYSLSSSVPASLLARQGFAHVCLGLYERIFTDCVKGSLYVRRALHCTDRVLLR